MGKVKTDPSVVLALVLGGLVLVAGLRAVAVLLADNGPYVEAWLEQLHAAALGAIVIALFTTPVVLLFAFTAAPSTRARARARANNRLRQKGAEQAISQVQAYTHNRDTAIRLIHQYCKDHPGQSLDWIVDKVVYDLVRDRR